MDVGVTHLLTLDASQPGEPRFALPNAPWLHTQHQCSPRAAGAPLQHGRGGLSPAYSPAAPAAGVPGPAHHRAPQRDPAAARRGRGHRRTGRSPPARAGRGHGSGGLQGLPAKWVGGTEGWSLTFSPFIPWMPGSPWGGNRGAGLGAASTSWMVLGVPQLRLGTSQSAPQPHVTYPVPFGSHRAGSVLGRGKQRGSVRGAETRPCSALHPARPPSTPHVQTHRDSVFAGCSGRSPGSWLARQPGGTEHPLGDSGTHLAWLTLPTGTVRCSPGLGGPRGGPRDAPSSPEPKGWAPWWSHAGRGCHARGHGTVRCGTATRRATLPLHPPCLLSAPGHRGVPVGGRQGTGLLQGALTPRIAPAVPPSTPQPLPPAVAQDSPSPE